MNYMEKLNRIMKEETGRIAFKSEGKSHGLTYGAIDRNSGKIYSWLKSHNIGKEDFVMLCLPRGVRMVVAMIGVLKAGAAFVVVENTYAPDRIAFIEKDCGCRIKIDEDVFMEMMEAEYLDGFENTDPHDAAYAVYTSGTTGNPKGVLHEYGNIEETCSSFRYEGKGPIDENSRLAMVAPMNFVASMIIIFNILIYKSTGYIVPYSIVKNPIKLQEFFIEEKITHTFMTASLLRIYREPAPSLKAIYISSEPANGVYIEGPKLYNLHAMSETGFATTMFKIDRPYDEAPIGKTQFDLNTYLLNEEGNPVADGEMGEFCFDNKYVRGYINLPEKTREAFRDGIFHSGDIAKRKPDGNIVLLGRNDDMIKINGNRIEPAEIEAAVKNTLELNNVIAKGFDNGKRAYICAYYLSSEFNAKKAREMTLDKEKLNEKLLKRIPYYMLPTYYVELSEFPMNANGKINRKALKEPVTEEFLTEYRAPSNELEEKLCAAFSKVLGKEKIGVDDDFYLLGGDSLSAMKLLTESTVYGFEIADLFKYRTPAKIAEALGNRRTDDENPDEEEESARKEFVKLNDEEIFVVDTQFEDPMSTMYNLSQLYKMKKGVDAKRLAEALEKVMRNHPAFSTKIVFDEDNEMAFSYDPNIFTAPKVIDISEKELLGRKSSLRKPFKRIVGRPLYRCSIFKTESSVYLLQDTLHAITDGTSLRIMREEIARCYKEPDAVLGKDYFYLVKKKRMQLEGSELWKEAAKYYSAFDCLSFEVLPKPDNDEFGLKMGRFKGDMGLNADKLEKSGLVADIGRNAFFILSFALATAALNNNKKQAVQGLLNGRDSAIKTNTFGLLFESVPVLFDFGKYENLGRLVQDTKIMMQKGTAYCSYPVNEKTDLKEGTVLIYQKDIYSLGTFGELADQYIELVSEDASEAVLEVNVIEEGTTQSLIVNYSAAMYEKETMEKIMNAFRRTASLLLEYGEKPDTAIDEILNRIKG